MHEQRNRAPHSPQPGPAISPDRVRLKFTGTCDLAEFHARCRKHDYWYHSYYFDNGFVQHGEYDIGLDITGYRFPSDMSGMSVLDIGTGSGWFAAYFEQRGADVTVTDVRGACDFDLFGRDHYPDISAEKPFPDRRLPGGHGIYYSPFTKGFWIMKDILGLKARYVNARVYEIRPELFGGKRFDLVFMGSVLMHLRDPIGAIMAAHSVCNHVFIATSYMLPDTFSPDTPVMRMWENGAFGGVSWWVPNRMCLNQWLKAAGFSKYNIDNTVQLTVDTPVRDASGRTGAVNQTHQLLHAYV